MSSTPTIVQIRPDPRMVGYLLSVVSARAVAGAPFDTRGAASR